MSRGYSNNFFIINIIPIVINPAPAIYPLKGMLEKADLIGGCFEVDHIIYIPKTIAAIPNKTSDIFSYTLSVIILHSVHTPNIPLKQNYQNYS